ncbi:hypothetical protein R5R35_002238 [Gryllus longicercus]|uniref:Uncharacterized protein n=1 Tax=Gryllus longicercus TaxID=2509291 RepID=A0AAN9VMH8_9ORTH
MELKVCHIIRSQKAESQQSKWNVYAGYLGKRDRNRNDTIREGLKVTPLLKEMENRLKWYGYVNRMAEDRKLKQMIEARPEAKRPPGRPRRKCDEYIQDIC